MKFKIDYLEKLNYNERLDLLSDIERVYYNVMKCKKGVLYLEGEPGLAKSAIARNIAYITGRQYIDIRLALVDETDVGLFPSIEIVMYDEKGEIVYTEKQGVNTFKALDFVVPLWAIKANSKPTIIHFEELNRTSVQVRNASLQILLEREIGSKFKFNDDVYMMSSGNLGEEDGTDVDEFDSALNNRLVRFRHNLTLEYWIENFANYNIHPLIIKFLKSNKIAFYRRVKDKNGDDEKSFATPRSWDFLSNYILTITNKAINDSYDIDNVLECSEPVGKSYIGSTFDMFKKYLENYKKFNTDDVINNYNDYEKLIKDSNRSFRSEVVNDLKNLDFLKLDNYQIDNIIKFVKIIDDDEKMALVTHKLFKNSSMITKKEQYTRFFKSIDKEIIEKVIDFK